MFKLLESLTCINDLKKSIKEIIEQSESHDDFDEAIQMCMGGKKLLLFFRQFQCIEDLNSKLDQSISRIQKCPIL